jgi:predicted DNA-binding WGR domain protein
MLILSRRGPRVNMARFCGLSLENSLFGDILLVRRLGRIGTGRAQFDWFDTPADAAKELARVSSVKARRRHQVLGLKAEPAGCRGASSASRDH